MKKIFPLLVIGFLASSCKKEFLELTPPDSYSPGNFYKTEAQMRQAVNAAYTPLRSLLDNDYFTGESRGGNTHYEYNAGNRGTAFVQRESITDFTDDPTNAYTNAVYFHCYSSISKANTVIERIADADIAQAGKNALEGEAKFLRAWNYFRLVRYFGGVPLYLKEVKVADDAFLPRASVEQVYAQIIADAQDAITKLAVPAKFPQSGTATKGAATMLLAEVYATQKKWAEAEALLITLPAMGYQLLPNYADVFSTANKNSRESIFEVQYMQGLQAGQQSTFIYQFLPRSTNTSLVTGVATNNTGTGGWNTPSADLMNSYEAGDKRKEASIGIAEGTYNSSKVFAISANKSSVNYLPAAGKVGVPYIKKYLNPHTDPNNTNDNWPVYRYADAVLLLAEAQNEQGKTAAAMTNVNLIRTRAGLTGLSGLAQADLRTRIAQERRIELAFENHRWFDLLRTGNATATMSAYGAKLKITNTYLGADTYQVNNNRLLFPIPQSEREINPDLTQNPGYF
ncbi:carbohydrate-binding protein SusD [Pedobacter sp. BMA]|nr:carbohydrate-binding protein SusD [Pedobacter sp. BMA]